MRAAVLTVCAVVMIAIGGDAAFIYTGVYDVAATSPHWPITYWAMETVRMESVRARAKNIQPPAGLGEQANVLGGVEHFAAHCAACHGAPGVPRGDLAGGLYPQPGDLTHAAQRYTAGELFWIVKNGIKMSGMPSCADHDDDELWNTVAFMEKLPAMSEADYAKLVMTSVMQGGGRHNHGGEPMPDSMPGMDHSAQPGPAPPPSK